MTTTVKDTEAEPESAEQESTPETRARAAVTISARGLLTGSAVVALAVVAIVLGVLLAGTRGELAGERSAAGDRDRAEQIARDYSAGAATVDFQNLDAWLGKLKVGTTPDLSAKFDATAPTLREILAPLRWQSSATPITAKVVSENEGRYTVNAFVNVTSTNAQNSEPVQTTVTYTVVVDRNADWKISDVGGLDGALPLG